MYAWYVGIIVYIQVNMYDYIVVHKVYHNPYSDVMYDVFIVCKHFTRIGHIFLHNFSSYLAKTFSNLLATEIHVLTKVYIHLEIN